MIMVKYNILGISKGRDDLEGIELLSWMTHIVLNKRRKTAKEKSSITKQLLLIFGTKSRQAVPPLIQLTDTLSAPSFLLPFHYR